MRIMYCMIGETKFSTRSQVGLNALQILRKTISVTAFTGPTAGMEKGDNHRNRFYGENHRNRLYGDNRRNRFYGDDRRNRSTEAITGNLLR